MPLALLTQRTPPLQLNFMTYPIQFLLAMMQPEVLIEALKHLPQMTLLSPARPMHVLDQPLVGAIEELATALYTRQPDHGESSTMVGPADMLEAEKLESVRPLTVLRASLSGKTAKKQQPSFLLGQFQVESCEALP